MTDETEKREFEVRGGAWEALHALIFYAAVACAVLSTAGVARLATGISAVILLFYSIFAIFSSPTYLVIDPERKALTWETYRYFIPLRREMTRGDLAGVEVVEARRIAEAGEDPGPRRDLSYFVRVYLKLADGRRRRVFRSGTTGSPGDNRAAAFLIVEALAQALSLPIFYHVKGGGGGEEVS